MLFLSGAKLCVHLCTGFLFAYFEVTYRLHWPIRRIRPWCVCLGEFPWILIFIRLSMNLQSSFETTPFWDFVKNTNRFYHGVWKAVWRQFPCCSDTVRWFLLSWRFCYGVWNAVADSSPVDWSDDSYYRVDFTKMSEMLDEDCSPVDRTPTMTPSIAEILPRCLKCW